MMSERLKQAGQITKHDLLIIDYRGVSTPYFVREVLNPGEDIEEVIVNKKDNIYFITSMAIDGTSWAKNVDICIFE